MKQARGIAENARVAVRNIRRDTNEQIKAAGLPEDEQKKSTEDIQKLTDSHIEEIAGILKAKEKEIMEV